MGMSQDRVSWLLHVREEERNFGGIGRAKRNLRDRKSQGLRKTKKRMGDERQSKPIEKKKGKEI